MTFSREERQELNALSKEVTGVASKWQKMARGVPELVTKKITETVPGENGQPDTTKESTVAALTETGAKQFRTRIYSFEEIRDLLLNIKKQRDDHFAKQAEAKAKAELEKKIHEQASGLV